MTTGLLYPKPTPRIIDKATQRREDGRLERQARQHVKARERGKCRCCGKPGSHLHHLRYRSRGGTWDPKALVWLCARCHALCHVRLIDVLWTDADRPDGVRFDRGTL
jgi:hypothetical protein